MKQGRNLFVAATAAEAKAGGAPLGRTADGTLSIGELIAGVKELYPGADAQSLRCVAELMAKPPRMTFDGFSAENRARCTAPGGFNHPLDAWSLSDWMTACVGELGEAANVLKKLNRERDGIKGNSAPAEQLRADFADELADTFIYLDLLAQAAGIDLAAAIRSKFDRTSAKIGYQP